MAESLGPTEDGILKEAKKIVRQKINSLHVDLSDAVKSSPTSFSNLMQGKGFITEGAHQSKDVEDIIRDYKTFVKTVDTFQKLEECCSGFLDILEEIGGPANNSANLLCENWNKEICHKTGKAFMPERFSCHPSPASRSFSDGQIQTNKSRGDFSMRSNSDGKLDDSKQTRASTRLRSLSEEGHANINKDDANSDSFEQQTSHFEASHHTLDDAAYGDSGVATFFSAPVSPEDHVPPSLTADDRSHLETPDEYATQPLMNDTAPPHGLVDHVVTNSQTATSIANQRSTNQVSDELTSGVGHESTKVVSSGPIVPAQSQTNVHESAQPVINELIISRSVPQTASSEMFGNGPTQETSSELAPLVSSNGLSHFGQGQFSTVTTSGKDAKSESEEVHSISPPTQDSGSCPVSVQDKADIDTAAKRHSQTQNQLRIQQTNHGSPAVHHGYQPQASQENCDGLRQRHVNQSTVNMQTSDQARSNELSDLMHIMQEQYRQQLKQYKQQSKYMKQMKKIAAEFERQKNIAPPVQQLPQDRSGIILIIVLMLLIIIILFIFF